ncbi:DUF6221 family protein [Actinomadura geliboluensis]|uniref:DUF6221 family protein n=1 Tax=Actinomadura geliboluensis TaxID=882440 RepID=UPI00369963EA
MSGLVEFLRARLRDTERALNEYREHRERGVHVNYEGQDPAQYDEWDSCARCIATAEASPYRDVEFGLAEVEAKRRIVEEAEQLSSRDEPLVCGAGEEILQQLALPYAAPEGAAL